MGKLIIISITGFLFLIVGCEKMGISGKKRFSGIVKDQVTSKPIQGATIYLANLPFNENGLELKNSIAMATTDKSGEFNFKVGRSEFTPESNYPFPYIYAKKDGFAGSSYSYALSDNDLNLELYHPSKLILRIWNDTINNEVNEAEIGIVAYDYLGYPGRIGGMLMCTPFTQVKCSGKDFDSLFVFYPIWSNMTHEIHLNTHCFKIGIFTIKPDSTLFISRSF